MKKLAKWLGFSLLGLIVLIIIAAVGLSFYLTDDRLRSHVLPRLQEYTGRDVQVERISYSLFSSFPRFGLIIEGLDVPDPVEDRLASVDRLELSLAVMPLISGEVRVHKLEIDRPEFTYIVYEDGTTNLDEFLPEEDAEEAPDEETDPMVVDLAGVVITNGTLGLTDHTSETSVMLADLDLETSFRLADVIESSLEATLGGLDLTVDGESLVSGLALSLTQTSVLNLEEETLVLEGGTFGIEGLALALEGTVSEWSAGGPLLDLRLETHSDDFGVLLSLMPDALQDVIADLDTGGELDLTASIQGRAGAEELPRFEASATVADGFMQHSAVPERFTGIALSVQANNDLITLEALQASAGEARLSANGQLRDPLTDSADYTLTASVNADLSTAERYVPLEEFGIDTLVGLVEINGQGEGPLSTPEDSQFDVSVKLDDGTIGLSDVGRAVENVAVDVRATNEAITITNLSARSFDNTFAANGSVNGYLGSSPSFDVSVVSQLALNELNEYYPVEEELELVMSGTVDADVRLRGGIEDVESAQVDGTVTLTDVDVESPHLFQPVRDLDGRVTLRGEEISAESFTFYFGESDVFVSGTLSQYRGLLVESGEGEPARFDGEFRSVSLDIDTILGYEPTQEDADDSEKESFEAELPNLTGDLVLAVDALTLYGIDATNFNCTLEMTPQHLGARRAEVGMFGGTVTGRFRWEIFAPDHTGLTFVGDVDRVRAEELFERFEVSEHSQLADHLTAEFSTSVDLFAHFDEYLEMQIETLRMDGDFGMDDGTISDHPIQTGLSELFRASEFRRLVLDSWTAAYRIADGRIHLSDVHLTSQDFGLDLSGSQSLTSGELDYRSEVILPPDWTGRLGGIVPPEGVAALTREDGRLSIPVAIRGTASDPSVGVDNDGIRERIASYLRGEVDAQRREAERQVTETVDALRDEAEERVEEVVNEIRDEAEERVEEVVDEVREEVEDQIIDQITDDGSSLPGGISIPGRP